ncbi:MAG: FAD-binding protein [Albidovulum sp.]|nr:FAD-binding protein [Albidovulum sp.]
MNPASESELAETVASATGPFAVIGGGTRRFGSMPDSERLSTRRLDGIRIYEPGALTLVASAGTPAEDVAALLAENGQRLAFEPMDYRAILGTAGTPTIGGIAATNSSGPRRIQAGACRDNMLGIRFVNGEGKILKNGGRVMKNVTGYDLVRLLAGSHGTLGILTEVAFKVLPMPESAASLAIRRLDSVSAVKSLSAALGSPFGVSGAAHLPGWKGEEASTIIRIEGFGESVKYRAGKLRDLLRGYGDIDVEFDQERVDATWRSIRDAERFSASVGDIWRISVKPSDAPGIVEKAAGLERADAMFDWGGGLVWMLVPEGTPLRDLLGDFSGHATLVRASPETSSRVRTFQPLPPAHAGIASALRRQFDPRGILNPGLMC